MAVAGTAGPAVNTPFLSGSHFSIAQDSAVTQASFKSIFKTDYPPWDISNRPPATEPPAPAAVMHRDLNRFNEKCSETVNAFEQKYLPKPELESNNRILGATNFKMDSDIKKFNSFQTSHKLDFPPKSAGRLSPGKQNGNPLRSFIPQGDREKASEPISDYRDRFRGHDAARLRPDKAKPIDLGLPSTIQGDQRQHHFSTTHNDVYQGTAQDKVKAFLSPTGSNIPQGDREKEAGLLTTQQESYMPVDVSLLHGYNRGQVMGKLQETNFTQSDGHGSWNNYQSTNSDSYRPITGHNPRSPPTKHRNHSDFPDGDSDPRREATRVNLTNYRFYHGDAPRTRMPKIESGAEKRTKSNVSFGEPRLNTQFYETTMGGNFKPSFVPYSYNRANFLSNSAVPMDYYANAKHSPTTWTDFQNPNQAKLIPNQMAIDNLRKSHIKPPLVGDHLFSTEHLDQYTPKQTKLATLDPGRLQRSSVPLGTLNA